jgi:hypothetical protein
MSAASMPRSDAGAGLPGAIDVVMVVCAPAQCDNGRLTNARPEAPRIVHPTFTASMDDHNV